jgi:hypothetical protein
MNWNPNQNDPYSPPHSAFQPKPGSGPYASQGANPQGPNFQGSDPYGQNPYAQSAYGQNPYGHQPPPRSGGGLLWLWILLGVGGGMLLLCCGCCGVLGFIGMNQEEQEIQAKLAGNPVIAEHIGEITSINRDWSKSIDEEDVDTWYFRLVGTLGEGDLIIKEEGGLNFEEEEIQIEWAKLRLDSGEEFDVLP